jgi:hypothetical protein
MAVANVRAATFAAGQPPFQMFPVFLGKNSSRGKRARQLAEMGLHMATHVSGGREAIRLDYLDPLRMRLFAPLVTKAAVEDPAAAADKSIKLLDEYGLSNTDMMETMIEVCFSNDTANVPPAGMVDYAKAVDSKVKAAFTRECVACATGRWLDGAGRARRLGPVDSLVPALTLDDVLAWCASARLPRVVMQVQEAVAPVAKPWRPRGRGGQHRARQARRSQRRRRRSARPG